MEAATYGGWAARFDKGSDERGLFSIVQLIVHRALVRGAKTQLLFGSGFLQPIRIRIFSQPER